MKYSLLALTLLLFTTVAEARQAQFYLDRAALSWSVDNLSVGTLVGENRSTIVREEEELITLARQEGIGYQEFLDANPGVDPWLPPDRANLLLPEHRILPDGIEPGITINLAEYLLYHVEAVEGGYNIRTYPVGIGQEGFPTPTGEMTVKKKIREPVWAVPPSVRREHPEYPKSFPPGPENALGDYWIGLSKRGYGLHGTNRPLGIGRRVSHGCVRLYPEDVEDLFSRVKIGTRVNIIYQPVKVAVRHNRLLVEYHYDFEQKIDDSAIEIIERATSLNWQGRIDWYRLLDQLDSPAGVPVVVSY